MSTSTHQQIIHRLKESRNSGASAKAGKRNREGAMTPVSPLGERPFPNPNSRGMDSTTDRVPSVQPCLPQDRYFDLGGISSVIQNLYETVEFPMHYSNVYGKLGVPPPSGVILYGPPGCGKTRLAYALAGECGVPLFCLPATEIVSGISGDAEARLRATFRAAEAAAPSIIFIDQIDAVAGTRGGDAPREMSRRLVAQLGLCLDGLASSWQAASIAALSQSSVDGTLSPTSPPVAASSTRGALPVVMCICATSALESVDASLRRPGRFEREISIPIPSRTDRVELLQVITRSLRLAADVDIPELARRTPGYVGADFVGVVKAAAGSAVRRLIHTSRVGERRALSEGGDGTMGTAAAAGVSGSLSVSISGSGAGSSGQIGDVPALTSPLSPGRSRRDASASLVASATADGDEDPRAASHRVRRSDQRHPPLTAEQLNTVEVKMVDFEDAIAKAQPCAMREGFTTVPSVTWDDVGALDGVKEELVRSIEMPVRYPHLYAKMGVRAAAGVLLYGPPGCGKTLVAKAAANGCGANFISIKGPELLNKFVGESERAVRSLFARARASAPCVLFFDELDALAPRRGSDSTNGVSDRVVNQLLTELDGVESRDGVFVVGATNRRDMIDDALLRPGRYDKVLQVHPPGPSERATILTTLLRRVPHEGLDLAAVASHASLQTASGADLAHIVKEAALLAIEREMARASAASLSTPLTAAAASSSAASPSSLFLLRPADVASAASQIDVDSVAVTQADLLASVDLFGKQRRKPSVGGLRPAAIVPIPPSDTASARSGATASGASVPLVQNAQSAVPPAQNPVPFAPMGLSGERSAKRIGVASGVLSGLHTDPTIGAVAATEASEAHHAVGDRAFKPFDRESKPQQPQRKKGGRG